MTYEPTVTDTTGNPIMGLLVQLTDLNTGHTFPRETDGNGYCNVAMDADTKPDHRVTIAILDPEYRFKGAVLGDEMTAAQADGKHTVVLNPFV